MGAIVHKSGHHCSMFDATFYSDSLLCKEFLRYIEKECCQLLLVHCTSADWWLVKLLLNLLRRKLGTLGPMTIVGGQHPTILPEEVLSEYGVDAVVLGEGELALSEILDLLCQGSDILHVKNCWVKQNGRIVRNPVRELMRDIDSLPYPQWDLFDNRHRVRYSHDNVPTGVRPINIETSRGCPYSCTFCMNSYYRDLYRGLGNYCRAKSAQRIISEALFAKDSLDINYIQFVDDNFLVFRDRLEELSSTFARYVHLPFSVQASADRIDASSTRLLKDMGIDMLAIGIESGNEAYREKILGKKVTDEQILRAINLAKEHGIGTMAYYMVGLPFETDEDIRKTIDFHKQVQPDICIVSSFFPFPGTVLHREAISKQLPYETEFGPDFFHGSIVRRNGLSEERLDKLRESFGETVTFFGPLEPRSRKNFSL